MNVIRVQLHCSPSPVDGVLQRDEHSTVVVHTGRDVKVFSPPFSGTSRTSSSQRSLLSCNHKIFNIGHKNSQQFLVKQNLLTRSRKVLQVVLPCLCHPFKGEIGWMFELQ
eukprot:Lithocolla_globosa_v1_NODE_5861_length_1173_cov_211.122540.p1 type:complete len:110 gc:universal NODE_5861_length_1173_cov_211.122540:451-122(-)